ncbi:MAG: hypothetical protein COB26_09185 [Piscirickettsiaceae bacterium]|nr:MAG: hypothetical protein COB26_09185 [Piscirickettsiaceae bacterium]
MSSTSLKLITGFLFLGYSAFALAYETETDLVEAKLEAAESYKVSNYRSSEKDGSTLYIKNTNFRVVDNIGFYIPDLIVRATPNDSSQPLVFDDPTSFSLTPLKGSVVIDSAKLEALLNKKVFAFKGATLRNIKVKTATNVLTLSGQMIRKGLWVPFVLKGDIKLQDGHILNYTPWQVITDGQDATMVLKAANVEIDELLTVDAPGAKLIGSTIVLDTLKLFPPPVLNLKISKAAMEDRGLVLSFDNLGAETDSATLTDSNSYILIKGGDVKFMKAVPTNARVQVMSTSSEADLDFCLYDYRDQLSAGHLKLKEDGAILAYLKN